MSMWVILRLRQYQIALDGLQSMSNKDWSQQVGISEAFGWVRRN